jgi:hypothetical protein
VLQGTLDTFGLGDVLTLIATTAKSGRLHLNGDRGTGSIWFEGGEIVAATAANVPPEGEATDVLFELLRYAQGEFSFDGGETMAEPGPPQAVGPVLEAAHGLLGQWRELTAVVPSLSHLVVLNAELVDDHVTLDRDQWRTVLAIGQGIPVGDLGRALGLAEVPLLRRVCELLDAGLVDVVEPAPPAPPAALSADPLADPPGRRWDDPLGLGGGPDQPGAGYEPAPAAGFEPAEQSLVDQLGGLSPRAAQAVSEVAARNNDDSVLMQFLRDNS